MELNTLTKTQEPTSQTITQAEDILAVLDTEVTATPTIATDDILASVDALTPESTGDILASADTMISDSNFYADLLKVHNAIKKAGISTWQRIMEYIKMFFHYIVVSCVVFVVLLFAANYSAYSAIIDSYVRPEYLKSSSADITRTMESSKIEVFADESNSHVTEEEAKAKEEKLREQLAQENVSVKDAFLSPKKLIPTNSDVSLDVEVVPYENRIIIPKLGKNIPLVDVSDSQGVSFDNLEDKFMKELEKGIIRYPGTAKPGEEGNAFIFGHSSNYPWMKGDYNDVFALLDQLVFGDEIIVFYNQQKYVYVIREKKVVKPGNVAVMKREDGKKELSLMTCWPVGTAINRLLVFAELKEGPTTDEAATPSN
jgi:LPXTG-site transpeptidase (sortase) family protein